MTKICAIIFPLLFIVIFLSCDNGSSHNQNIDDYYDIIGYIVDEQDTLGVVQHEIRWGYVDHAVSFKDTIITFRGKPTRAVARLMCTSFYPAPLTKEEMMVELAPGKGFYHEDGKYYLLAWGDSIACRMGDLLHRYNNELIILRTD